MIVCTSAKEVQLIKPRTLAALDYFSRQVKKMWYLLSGAVCKRNQTVFGKVLIFLKLSNSKTFTESSFLFF